MNLLYGVSQWFLCIHWISHLISTLQLLHEVKNAYSSTFVHFLGSTETHGTKFAKTRIVVISYHSSPPFLLSLWGSLVQKYTPLSCTPTPKSISVLASASAMNTDSGLDWIVAYIFGRILSLRSASLSPSGSIVKIYINEYFIHFVYISVNQV